MEQDAFSEYDCGAYTPRRARLHPSSPKRSWTTASVSRRCGSCSEPTAEAHRTMMPPGVGIPSPQAFKHTAPCPKEASASLHHWDDKAKAVVRPPFCLRTRNLFQSRRRPSTAFCHGDQRHIHAEVNLVYRLLLIIIALQVRTVSPSVCIHALRLRTRGFELAWTSNCGSRQNI